MQKKKKYNLNNVFLWIFFAFTVGKKKNLISYLDFLKCAPLTGFFAGFQHLNSLPCTSVLPRSVLLLYPPHDTS